MQKPVKTKVSNRIEYIDLDPGRYKLYQRRPCRMENMCGKFATLIMDKQSFADTLSVSRTCMGQQEDVYNVFGNGCFLSAQMLCQYSLIRLFEKGSKNKMFIRGCANFRMTQLLAADLGLEVPSPVVVHMVVVAACIGELVDVLPGGLMEDMLQKLGYGPYRVPDTTNQIRFSVPMRADAADYIPVPRTNDWTITTRGSVIVRMTWDSIEWTQEVEDRVLMVCECYVTQLRELLAEV